MTYTIKDIMALRPCYTREQVAALFGGRESMTAAEIASTPIPHTDRVWVLVRLATPKVRVLWACECAERALIREREAGREPDALSWRVVDVARAWTRDEATIDELRVAAAAAEAAWAARAEAAEAAEAAWAEAWAAAAAAEAARAEAAEAAEAAAAAEAAEAAWAEAWAAARAAAEEREWQIVRLAEMMG